MVDLTRVESAYNAVVATVRCRLLGIRNPLLHAHFFTATIRRALEGDAGGGFRSTWARCTPPPATTASRARAPPPPSSGSTRARPRSASPRTAAHAPADDLDALRAAFAREVVRDWRDAVCVAARWRCPRTGAACASTCSRRARAASRRPTRRRVRDCEVAIASDAVVFREIADAAWGVEAAGAPAGESAARRPADAMRPQDWTAEETVFVQNVTGAACPPSASRTRTAAAAPARRRRPPPSRRRR